VAKRAHALIKKEGSPDRSVGRGLGVDSRLHPFCSYVFELLYGLKNGRQKGCGTRGYFNGW
jgi:hypothetical protein